MLRYLLLALTLVPSAVRAQENAEDVVRKLQRESLHGIKGVLTILRLHVIKGFESAGGPSDEKMLKAANDRLVRNGVKIVSEEERTNDSVSYGYLLLEITCLGPPENGVYAVNVKLQLSQKLQMPREPFEVINGITWERSKTIAMHADHFREVTEKIEGLVDEFSIDLGGANKK